MIELNHGVVIREKDLAFVFSRSSGPGGQNVNKVSSRVTLLFDLVHCQALTDSQKARIRKRLASRVDRQGRLRVVCQKFRTQQANRRAAMQRLADLLTGALKRRRPRKTTKVPRSAVEKRLRAKKHRGQIKQQRAGPNLDPQSGRQG